MDFVLAICSMGLGLGCTGWYAGRLRGLQGEDMEISSGVILPKCRIYDNFDSPPTHYSSTFLPISSFMLPLL